MVEISVNIIGFLCCMALKHNICPEAPTSDFRGINTIFDRATSVSKSVFGIFLNNFTLAGISFSLKSVFRLETTTTDYFGEIEPPVPAN